jgi:hypothetical protein
MMRRFFILSAAALLCLQAVAQNAASQIKDLLASNRVSISYSYSDSAGNELGKGLATVQGHCYKVIESGTTYCCDGSTLWTEIPRSKEIYIENERQVDRMNTAQIILPLSPASVLAMQHAIYAGMGRLFSFTLVPERIPEFSSACEKYLENHVDHHFAVLDMLIN